MLNRDIIVERLIDDDIDTIIHNAQTDYLRDLVVGGFKGYSAMSDIELIDELNCRGIDYDMEEIE